MLEKLLKRKSKGFTLIEIVLVLAIAGLILVIVFLAVTGAQKAQRDNARKDYVNRLAAEVVEQYGDNSSSWDCSAAASVTILASINKPTLGSAGTPTANTTAASTSNANLTGTLTTCTVTMLLENGGNYARTVTP